MNASSTACINDWGRMGRIWDEARVDEEAEDGKRCGGRTAEMGVVPAAALGRRVRCVVVVGWWRCERSVAIDVSILRGAGVGESFEGDDNVTRSASSPLDLRTCTTDTG